VMGEAAHNAIGDRCPNLDPRIRKFLFPKKAVLPLPSNAPRKDVMARLRAREAEDYLTAPILAGEDWKSLEGVTVESLTIPCNDGSTTTTIPLDVYSPANHSNKGKAKHSNESVVGTVVFFHGGGMVIYSKEHPVYVRTAKELARAGMRVVVPEFRSALEAPFPNGLHDCYEAALWASRKYGPVVLFGDSGGGNLCHAVILLAKIRNQLEHFIGTYTLAPYVWGKYPDPKFPSVEKYDGLTYTMWLNRLVCAIYTHDDAKNADSPLAWPGNASVTDLKGCPPAVVHVNEYDMLIDTCRFFYYKLLKAGVKVTYVESKSTCHDADLWYGLLPELNKAFVERVKKFVKELKKASETTH